MVIGTGRHDLYLGPLDGLRFLAFMAVFFHHMPRHDASSVLTILHDYGWAGVEFFFLIAAFLFFYLLSAEHRASGTISILNFFIRRLLRIFPLMMLFSLSMLLLFGDKDGYGWQRLAGIGLFMDNVMVWARGYNGSVPYTAHLWSLAFEFQVYLLIPSAFLLYCRIKKRNFLYVLGIVFAYCFLARFAFHSLGVKHPIIWVTPFLRPESVLAGVALFVYRPRWNCYLSLAAGILAGAGFLMLTPPWASSLGSALSYPLAAIMFGGIVDAGLRSPALGAVLSLGTLRYLGRISYGLYIFHFLFIPKSRGVLAQFLGRPVNPQSSASDYWILWATALGLTVIAASISYFCFEKWISRYKGRFAAVEGRAA